MLLSVVLLLLAGAAQAEKLSVLLPGQEGEFSIHDPGLALPALAAPSAPSAPAAPSPRSPAASIFDNIGQGLQPSVPSISGLYEVPEEEEEQVPDGACLASTVVVTSRIVSTQVSVTRVIEPTTIVRTNVITSTRLQYQTVSVPGPTQTLTQTRVVTSAVVQPTTIYVTSTSVQERIVTSTQVQVNTQVVTSLVPDPQYVTVTQTRPVVQTVVSTEVVPQYVTATVTQTQYLQNTVCDSIKTTTSVGYNYPVPANTGAAIVNVETAVTPATTEATYGYGYYGGGYANQGRPGYIVAYPTTQHHYNNYNNGHYRRPYRPYGNRGGKGGGLFGKFGK